MSHSPVQSPGPVLFEDDRIVVFDKPSGLLSVPGIGPEKADCLASRAAAQHSGARIVHRLDRDTSGVIILVLLGAHMLAMHMSGVLPIDRLNPAGDNPLDWANVVARGREVSQVVGYILLVGVGLFHGLYGLRNILFELTPAPGLKKLISVVLLLLGLGLFVFGAWSAVAARTMALSVSG